MWYRYAWDVTVHGMPWTGATVDEVDFVAELVGLAAPRRILDVACGEGRHAIELAKRGHQVVGVDISATLLESAREAAAAAGVGNIQFEQMDIRAIPFEAEFDVVVNLWEGAIGYLEDDAENNLALAALARALVPGGHHVAGPLINAGYLAAHCPVQLWESSQDLILLARLDWDAVSRRIIDHTRRLRRGPQGDWRFEAGDLEICYRVYTPAELSSLLSDLGVETLSIYRNPSRTPGVGIEDLEYWIHSVKSPRGASVAGYHYDSSVEL
jgi:SAM-dependent methyltransferase